MSETPLFVLLAIGMVAMALSWRWIPPASRPKPSDIAIVVFCIGAMACWIAILALVARP